ncbi:MAG: hypothetical protein EPN70_01535 [Paraburkholderia sp.]|uniref:DUF5594 family protein n=1 Tax=Paraburkholderia sp. TaxID=1926495 RepID=UPI0012002EF4|nr:DUF5594 family protein [Paraburkholderia sp.]TAM07945.1 MAG: hypothetical protein EPN70_01535 [Paraburkholderia sp.]TAM31811.1 MAG: hypothetical protein EPN59_04245 [Paraburkholderia sp.]
MSHEVVHRFEVEFAPRIAAKLASQFGPAVRVEVVPREGRGHPTRVRLVGATHGPRHVYPYALNVSLTWDVDEIERLMEPGGEARFEHYLEATVRKMASWESARSVDFASCTQNEPEVLIGGLDFEG